MSIITPEAVVTVTTELHARAEQPVSNLSSERHEQTDVVNPFAGTDAILARWVEEGHIPADFDAKTQHAAYAEPASNNSVEDYEPPKAPSERVRSRAASLLREWGRPDLAEQVRERIPYKQAYGLALRQLREESPELGLRELRRLARRVARSVAFDDEVEGLFGFYAAPEQESKIGMYVCSALQRAVRSLSTNKVTGSFLLLAGEAYRKLHELPPTAKVVAAGLGTVAVSAPLLAQVYEGIQDTVENIIPNLKIFQQPAGSDSQNE